MIIIWTFARVLWRLFSAIVSITHAVYIHLNVTYFASKSFEVPKGYVVDMFLISEFRSLTKAFFIVQVVLIPFPATKELVLNSPQSPRAKWSFKAKVIIFLLSFYDKTRTVTLLF